MTMSSARSESALAISTNCWPATVSSPTGRLGSIATPNCSSRRRLWARISFTSVRPRAVRGSWPRKMFSATLMSGSRLSSW